jgi:hypothetical protein
LRRHFVAPSLSHVFLVRLKVMDGRITELETLRTDKGEADGLRAAARATDT